MTTDNKPKMTPVTSPLSGQFRLMEDDREVRAALLYGEYGHFWALNAVEMEIIQKRGKLYLPFNHGTGRGWVLKQLGLREEPVSPEAVAEMGAGMAKHRAVQDDYPPHHINVEPSGGEPEQRSTARRGKRSKRKINVSGF